MKGNTSREGNIDAPHPPNISRSYSLKAMNIVYDWVRNNQCFRLKIRNPWSRKWQHTPVFLAGKSHGQRSLVGYSSSLQFSPSVMFDSMRPHGLQHARFLCPSCPSGQWCHPTVSSSVTPFSSCLQSFPAEGAYPVSQFFTSGGQSIGVSASASVLPMNIQDWFPSGRTSCISLQSKGLSRVFSNTTVQKYRFFSAQLSL